MIRWKAAWIVASLASLFVLLFHAKSSSLLLDSDTSVLLRAIHARNAPFSWFFGDWPLFNHFYRPIPTLLFEMDSRLYGTNAAGYGWTNAILGAGCVMATFWLLRELVELPIQAMLGAMLFAIWQTGLSANVLGEFTWIALIVLVVGIVRHRRSWKSYVPAFCSILFLRDLLNPAQPLAARTLDWLPGRTATSMALVALLAMACYARYERLGVRRFDPDEATANDVPATKSARADAEPSRYRSLLAGLAVLFTALAFASYEQAVMLPACLLGLAVFFHFTGYRTKWALQIPFWGLLVAYLALRHSIIPPGKSAYQAQQLRSSFGGTWLSLSEFAYPAYNGFIALARDVIDQGGYVFLSGDSYLRILYVVTTLVGTYQLRRRWQLAFTGWALSVLAFLPMAFVKLFEHYYYWPMALQTILVVAAGAVAWELGSSALSPPVVLAPRRLDPAPGSLLSP